jgi:hypothetical protein
MANDLVATKPPPSSWFHPLVYKAAVGFVALFALMAWVLFDRQWEVTLPLIMVSVLLFVAVLLPYVLWRVWRRNQTPRPELTSETSFRQWAREPVEVGQSRLKGMHAAIDMLLPLAAVAIGLMAMGIAFDLAR